ncbi:hypothetical protein MTBBW1_1360001 [Desulfamplus magnetovallimortis]|uniref:Uncharacterized protein n=1 Tax=Desulfamplus magnetovallimortis TaxID=1246637 RepID=A0A1W1H7N2_9BACT|nr:hypothetical protein MTBBW1_1360001 [Desulfamplus magnetovallimortis]
MSQSPLIGAVFLTEPGNQEPGTRETVSIPSNRGSVSDDVRESRRGHWPHRTKSQSPLIGAVFLTNWFECPDGKEGISLNPL